MDTIKKVYWKPQEVATECKVSTQSIRNWEKETNMRIRRNISNERRYNERQLSWFKERARLRDCTKAELYLKLYEVYL